MSIGCDNIQIDIFIFKFRGMQQQGVKNFDMHFSLYYKLVIIKIVNYLTSFIDKLTFCFSGSIPITLTSTISPTATTSEGFLTKLLDN